MGGAFRRLRTARSLTFGKHLSRALAIRLVGATVATGGLALIGVGTIGAPVFSNGAVLQSAGGNNNKGDVWVDNVGQVPGPGHEMDPHLTCTNINLWGDKMADSSGTYTILGWPPSGTKKVAYSGNWTYDKTAGGVQNLLSAQTHTFVNVTTLIANAKANGDAPVNSQGFHFKLDFSQDPQKHKTFWVTCEPTTSTTSSTTSSTASSTTSSSTSSTTSTAPGSSTSSKSTVTSSAGTGVLGASTKTPSTGADVEFGLGLGLMIGGGAMAFGAGPLFRRLRK